MADPIDALDPGYRPLYDALRDWAERTPAIRGLFLTGSLAAGTADRHSDLDMLVVSAPPLLDDAERAIATVEAPLIVHRLPPGDGAFILSVVTEHWHRIDVAFAGAPTPGAIPVYNPDALTVPPAEESSWAPTAEYVLGIVTEFLRIYGLSVVVLGRGDVHATHDGAHLMRGHLIDLLLAEIPAVRPGPKKLLPALTDEHQSILRSLPPLRDDRESLLAFNRAIDRVFVPRARALLEGLGGTWPARLEDATRAYLARGLPRST